MVCLATLSLPVSLSNIARLVAKNAVAQKQLIKITTESETGSHVRHSRARIAPRLALRILTLVVFCRVQRLSCQRDTAPRLRPHHCRPRQLIAGEKRGRLSPALNLHVHMRVLLVVVDDIDLVMVQ